MLKRVVALVLAFVFAGLVTVGGAMCAGKSDAKSCCCVLGDTPISSPAMKMCCELACGKKTGDVPSTSTDASSAVAARDTAAAIIRVEPFDTSQATAVPVALKSARSAVSKHDPPDLYIQKATFLI